MKKIYSTFGMLAAFAVASAANVSGVKPEVQNVGQYVHIENIPQDKMAQKAPAKVSSAEDMLGNYMWVGFGGLESSNGFEQSDMQLVKSGDKVYAYGINVFSDVDVQIEATIDVAKGIVSLPAKVLIAGVSLTGAYDIYYEHQKWNDNGQGVYSSSEPLNLVITEDGSLAYEDDKDLIALCAYENGELVGYYRLLYMNNFIKRPTKLSNEGWEDFGTATVTENWFTFCPYFDIKVNSYEVKAQRSTEDRNIYRIVNPYGEGTPFAAYNTSAAEGEIIFDLTYPECVVVNGLNEVVWSTNTQTGEEYTCIIGTWAGFMEGISANYVTNMANLYMVQGFTQEDILDEMGAAECSFYDAETNEIVIVDAGFTMSTELSTLSVYSGWTEAGQMGTPTIKFNDPGSVEGIDFDSNAPVHYYNFQGIEVVNPENGQLVIKKQGSKVQKVIF